MDPARWLAAVLIALLSIPSAPAKSAPEWEDETITDIGTEAPRATLIPYPTRDDAIAKKNAHSMSLSGTWQFNFSRRPDERPVDFYKTDFDVSAWTTIKVPGNWQMQGFGRIIIMNVTYPFKNDPPRVTGEPPKDWVAYENRNEVGSYRRDFELPADWDGREVFLHFGGVESAMYVWVNGERVGYSEDSYTPAEFRITKYLKPGKNTVAAEVYRWSDGSYLEDQDFYRLSGIFRDVYVYATPKAYLRDVKVDAMLDAAYRDGSLKVTARVRNVAEQTASGKVAIELLDAAGKTVMTAEKPISIDAAGESAVDFSETVAAPAQWNAETPNLYTLLITHKDDAGAVLSVDRTRVGFRSIEIKDSRFLINGRAVKLRGVNRHETHPDLGRAVDESSMLQDILIFKRNNIDTVRTCHYPNNPRWYELCDEYGIYVVDEANVESHGTGYGANSLSRKPSWRKAHVERAQAMVQRDKNHPCVVMWSYGNEAGPGENFAASRDAVKAIDTTRPTHYEGNSEYADVHSEMYPGHARVRAAGERVGPEHKPFFLCEYAHAQGNAVGGLQQYWEIIEGSPRLMGGCIWDFVDQGLRMKAPDGKRSPDGKDFFFAYGGDFKDAAGNIDMPNDGLTGCDGLVAADRAEGAKIAELKRVYQTVKFAAVREDETLGADGAIKITNKRAFTSLDGLTVNWAITADGETIQKGTMPAPAINAGETGTLNLPIESMSMRAGREYLLDLSLTLTAKTVWADAGHVVAQGQLRLPVAPPSAVTSIASLPAAQLERSGDVVNVRAGKTLARFDLTGAVFQSLEIDGRPVFADAGGPTLQVYRAPGDNDNWVAPQWRRLQLDQLKLGAHSGRLTQAGDSAVRVTLNREWLAGEDVRFTEVATYTVLGDGTIDVVVQIGCNRETLVLPRQGVRMFMPGSLDRVTWFGRGPIENYPDRIAGASFGRYTTTVAKMFESYVRPQTMGNRGGTRWLTMTDADGRGLMISAPTPIAFTALHHTDEELNAARHPTDLVARKDVVLSLDAATLGIGTASCGPRPLPQFELRAVPRVLHYQLRGIDSSTADLADVARRVYPLVAPVQIARDRLGQVSLTCDTPNAAITYSIDGAEATKYTGPFEWKGDATIVANAAVDGMVNAPEARQRFERMLDRSGWRATASSEQVGEGDAARAIDGDPSTYWHTQYTGAEARPPHEFTLDLGKVQPLTAITYLPRQDSDNGRARTYELRVSDTGDAWTKIGGGRLSNDDGPQIIKLEKPTNARFVKWVILTEVRNRPFGTIGELSVTVEQPAKKE